MTFTIYGTATSSGIAIGPACLLGTNLLDSVNAKTDTTDRLAEANRLEEAVSRTIIYLEEVKNNIPSSAPREAISFVDIHRQMVCDESLVSTVVSLLERNNCTAEWALRLYEKDLSSFFEKTGDSYFESRKEDIRQVINLILKNFSSQLSVDFFCNSSLKSSIVVAQDLSPSDLIMLSKEGISGFCTEFGANLSHTAILARSLGLSFVIGVQAAMKLFRDQEIVVVDGEKGLIFGEPDNTTLNFYESKICKKRREEARIKKIMIDRDVVSFDGKTISIYLNLDIFEDIYQVPEYESHPVGLFRTEFLFMNRSDSPAEGEQFEVYKNILEHSNGQELTIRTADLGPDKLPKILKNSLPEEAVSALGLRGLRFSLKEKELFLVQLRAVIRASAFGKVRLLLPMVTEVEEVKQVKETLKKIKQEFRSKGIDFAKNIPLGAMIEVPAAAAACSLFAAELDFLSIGSNDLIQYTNAADRGNNYVSYLYQPLHPGVIQLIFWTISAAKKAKKPIFLCGEMASDHRYLPLLLGLGLTQISVRPSVILDIKNKIKNTSVKDAKLSVEEFMNTGDPGVLKTLLGK